MRTSGVASASGGIHEAPIDPVLSEKLLSTAVAALQEIASDDNSAGNIAKQGALRMLNVVATFASELKLRAKAIVTICNMLSTGELESLLLHIEDDMQDALDVLVMLHRQIIKDFDIAKSGFIATALHNLSCTAAGRLMMKRIGEGVVEATVWIAQQQAPGRNGRALSRAVVHLRRATGRRTTAAAGGRRGGAKRRGCYLRRK